MDRWTSRQRGFQEQVSSTAGVSGTYLDMDGCGRLSGRWWRGATGGGPLLGVSSKAMAESLLRLLMYLIEAPVGYSCCAEQPAVTLL